MLAKKHRLTASSDFQKAIKHGTRAGSATVVVHYYCLPQAPATGDLPLTVGGPRFGFVVSKQVGNAVVRHAVSRKLRHVCATLIDELPRDALVVVRALPAASSSITEELAADVASGLKRARKKWAAREQ